MKKALSLAVFALLAAIGSGSFAQDIKKSSPQSRQQPGMAKMKKNPKNKAQVKRKTVKVAPAKSVYKSR
jgi:hypothetical protein